jgi:hypothetical protein
MTAPIHVRSLLLALGLGLLPTLPSQGVGQQVTLPAAPQPVSSDNRNPSLWNNFKRDLVQEGVNLGACKEGFKGVPGCAETLVTGTPFHVSVGSLAPQNGIAAGLAFAEVYHPTYCASWLDGTQQPPPGTRNPCHWSLNMNAAGMASGNNSWRAGLYVTAVHLSTRKPTPHTPTPGHSTDTVGLCHVKRLFTQPSSTVTFTSEGDSLTRLYFYGLGPSTLPGARTDFGLTENITGINAVIPVNSGLLDGCGLTLLGELNGRFASVRGSYGDSSPSIETVYSNISAPGLAASQGYVQAGEGFRLIPPLPQSSHLKLNYLVNFQQFAAPSATRYSFRRFTADLGHTLTLYSKDIGKPTAPRPPLPGAPERTIPPISPTRDVTGSITAGLFIQESVTNAGHVVPFVFDPTLGGSDINSQTILSSYPDYRFRAPNLLLIHGAFEHSLGKIPIGLFLGIDEAKVGLRRDDISFSHLRHSYSGGITIHAGGLPTLYLGFAWGGNEGHRTIVNLNTALLGPSTRPSLF